MDCTTVRVASEEMLPHELVVKKIKKYSGGNYGKNGKIYKMPANRLETLRLGRVKVDGKVQSVYKFSKAKYEECEEMELKFQNKMRQQASKRAIANFGKGKKGK